MREWQETRVGLGELSLQDGFDLTQALKGALATLLLLLWIQGERRWWVRCGWSWRAQTHTADLEVFLEPVGLEEVGEFEGADIAALGTDFTLEVKNDGAQVRQRVASPQEFKPHAFAVESQAQGLAGQLAVELVGLVDGGGIR
jgi:hypothetical protein